MKSIPVLILLAAAMPAIFSCSMSNKSSIDPSAIARTNSVDTGYIFGTYNYEKKSPPPYGEDWYLTLLVAPAEDNGEKLFRIRLDHDSGFFLYPVKPGKYEIRELCLYSLNSSLTVCLIHDFRMAVANGDISYLGKLSLFLFCDGNGNISVSAISGTNEFETDRTMLSGKIPRGYDFNFTASPASINVPRAIYLQTGN
jgi:hypothetical protein